MPGKQTLSSQGIRITGEEKPEFRLLHGTKYMQPVQVAFEPG